MFQTLNFLHFTCFYSKPFQWGRTAFDEDLIFTKQKKEIETEIRRIHSENDWTYGIEECYEYIKLLIFPDHKTSEVI